MATSYNSFKGDILVGKSNYIEWLSNAKLFFEINGFMPYIDDTENEPDQELYYNITKDPNNSKETIIKPKTAELGIKYADKLSEYNRNSAKSLGAIKSIISKDNIERFSDRDTASELYDAIQKAFGESSLDTIGRYYNKLNNASYNNSKSMDEYTSIIYSSSIHLRELKCIIPNPLIIHIIFKGLPSSFEPLISRKYEDIGKSLTNIDISKLISELIAEEARMTNSIDLKANKAKSFKSNYNSNNTTPFCTHCNKKGHLESKCYAKYPELKKGNININNNINNKYKGSNHNPNSKFKNNKGFKKNPNKTESNKLIMSCKIYNSTLNINNNINRRFILDSGATEHFTCNKDWLINYKSILNKNTFVANGTKIPILGIGSIPIIINNREILITGVNYTPEIDTTLISSKELANKGWTILFKDNIADLNHIKLNFNIKAIWDQNSYYLNLNVNNKALESVIYKVDSTIYSSINNNIINYNSELNLYHKRLNHINKDYLIKTLKQYSINAYKDNNKLNNNILADCESCHIGKFHQKVSYKPLKAPKSILTFYDIDICGPFKVKGLYNERYFFSFTDRKTRAVWIYAIKAKSDAIDIIAEFINLIYNQFNIKIKGFRLDNAAEFKSAKWNTLMANKGIICEYTSPYTPAQNGIAEILNKYIINRLITISKDKSIPFKLWPYIIQAIAHIKNRTYNSIINKTPWEAITGYKPDITYLRILGSLTYSIIPLPYRDNKFDNKAYKGILVGFASSNNYLVYIPLLDKVINTRDIIIKEELTYKDEFIINEDIILLEENSPDYDYFNNSTSNNNNNNDTISDNSEINKSPDILAEDLSDNLSESDQLEDSGDELNNPIGDISQPKGKSREIIEQDNHNDDNNTIDNNEIDELSQEHYNITTRPKRLRKDISYKGLNISIYYLAASAYTSTLNKGETTFIFNTTSNTLNNQLNEDKILIYKKDLVKLNLKDNLFKDPKSYKEAHNSVFKDYWLKAEQNELNSLKSNNTWDLINKKDLNLSSNLIKPLKTRWVYKIKESNDYYQFKARFVAKGFEQLYGLDFIDSYASVIKQIAWKLIFALAIINNWFIYKADMISAFTQGDIDINHLYLNLPEGIDNLNPNDYLLKLNKALYGLKQSARIWYFTLYNILIKLSFTALKSESCIFINKELNLIICVYVDDLAIIGPDKDIINNFINSLSKYFNLKNLGPIKDYLGIDIELNHNKGYIKLSQAKYINKILEKYSMNDCNPISTPMDAKLAYKLAPNPNKATIETIKWFQGLIGSLLYLMLGTRLDIAFAVIKLARYASNPSEIHIIALKRILRYLKGSIYYNITYYNNINNNEYKYISGYTDADYAGDLNTAKSTTGFIFYLANGPISWKSKLQTIIAQSTTEAEYIAINAASKEAIYIKTILLELNHYKQDKFPIYSDNNGALQLAKNPVFHERTKHIAVKYHYIRDLINNGTIDLIYINTLNQKADGLTKALEKIKFKRFLEYLGFIN